jgi:hypothetical protein
MIQKVDVPPLAFEQTVRDVLTAPLGLHGFAFEETFHLYVNELAAFVRWRQGAGSHPIGAMCLRSRRFGASKAER